MSGRRYSAAVHANGSDVYVGLELRDGDRLVARVDLIDVAASDPGDAGRYAVVGEALVRFVDLVSALGAAGVPSARVATHFADACAFIQSHPLEGPPHAFGLPEAAELPDPPDPAGQG